MRLSKARFKFVLVAISCEVLATAQAGVTLTRLASFNRSNGSKPWGGLVQGADANFYGTTSFGGAYNSGTVFKMTPAGTLTTLYSFRNNSGGAVPSSALTFGSDGNLYGTTRDAPPYFGTIFKITTNGLLTTLVRFAGDNGATPLNGPLIQGLDSSFYGMTVRGGNSSPYDGGTAFRMTAGGALTVLHRFEYSSGDEPYGGLIQATDGDFYGMTSSGGPLGGGTVFRLSPTGAHTPLVAFSYLGATGLNPYSALLQAIDRNFYGTTVQGGESYGNTNSVNSRGFGTIFKLTPNGVFTTLYHFHGTNGAYPNASLVQGRDGNLYGTTSSGGARTNQLFETVTGYAGYGTLFRITTNGVLNTLASLDGTNGSQVLGSLMQAGDGNFYGTTIAGGQFNLGTVFRLNVSSPPMILCPAPAIVECGSPTEMFVRVTSPDGAALTVIWDVNGLTMQTNLVSSGTPPVVADLPLLIDLPLGTNLITVTVNDSSTNAISCSTIFTVVDTTLPVILFAGASPSTLWPPNHQMVAVNITANAADLCGFAHWRIADVKCNESAMGPGHGSTLSDWVITSDQTVNLRAERSAKTGERVYFISVEAIDEGGNVSTQTVLTVTVPSNLGKRK
jgi:uncharacterized repeat protein (TIGR03803 family)